MAKFNEKALCLFYKTYDQLEKEAERRGMRHEGREKTIAKIIWKDAYDAGVNEGIVEGKNRSALGRVMPNCPANCCGNAKPEVKEYCLHDMNDAMKYRLELTNEQITAIEWMIDRGFIQDVEFSEWDDTFEDVGRI
jgi:hypothetical protein